MRILGARIHVLFDVLFAVAFVLGPLLVGLGGSPLVISLIMAVAFAVLALTAARRARRGAGSVPIVHGLVELVLGILLALMPRIDGYSPGSPARHFYWSMAAALAVVWLLTAYGGAAEARRETAPGYTRPRATGV